MELMWDILTFSFIATLIILVWLFLIGILLGVLKNLKKMPKQPEVIPLYNAFSGKWVSQEEYQGLLNAQNSNVGFPKKINEYRKNLGYPEPKPTDMAMREYKAGEGVYDAEKHTPWNVRDISSARQNGKRDSDV